MILSCRKGKDLRLKVEVGKECLVPNLRRQRSKARSDLTSHSLLY